MMDEKVETTEVPNKIKEGKRVSIADHVVNIKIVPTENGISTPKSAWELNEVIESEPRRRSSVSFGRTTVLNDYTDFEGRNNSFSSKNGENPKFGEIRKIKEKKHRPTTTMSDGFRRVDFVLVYENEIQDGVGSDKKSDNGDNALETQNHRTFSVQSNNDEPIEKNKAEEYREFFHETLRKEGLDLEFETFSDKRKSLTFVKIHATWNTLCKMAEKIRLKMPLWIHDAPVIQKKSQISLFIDNLWYCLWYSEKIREKRRRSLTDKTLITWAFSADNVDRYAVIDKRTFFSDKQRIEIVWEVLQNARNDPLDRKRCGIERLINKGIYESCYPLHEGRFECEKGNWTANKTLRQKLTQMWATWGAFYKPQPLDSIRKYFGEKISFYFAFMDFYTKMLIFPTIIGFVAFMYGLLDDSDDEEMKNICDHHHAPGNWYHCPICTPPACEATILSHEGCMKYGWDFRLDNEATMALSYLIMIWAILFLKFWKRRESRLAADWDTLDVKEEDSLLRSDFTKRAPSQRINPITLQNEPHMPFSSRAYRMMVSVLITISVLCAQGLCLLILLITRIALYGGYRRVGGFISKYSVDYARWTIHGFIFITIAIFERIYHYVAHKLTEFECPRTNNNFLSSLLWKLFIFEMLNEFMPIWYAAFIKGRTQPIPTKLSFIDELCDGSCMFEVTELVAVLLLLRLVVGNFLEIGVPLFKNLFTKLKSTIPHTSEEEHPQWVRDSQLQEVEMDGVYQDYMEMMIQLGFILLFIPAFPLAPLVCLINNIIEIRLDSIKILRFRRRPVPIRVPGIYQWNLFMDIIVKLAVVCNAGLLAFTSDIVARLYYKYHKSEQRNLTGFIAFMMSNVSVADYGEKGEEMLHHNITLCVYSDMRESLPPYNLVPDFWFMVAIRIALFATYLMFFFGLMWIMNICVSDIPNQVLIANKRKKYIVMKCLEAEGGLHKMHWDNSQTQDSGTQLNNRNRSFDWRSETMYM